MTTTDNTSQDFAINVTSWEIDPQASRIEFIARIRLMFLIKLKVQGRFSDVRGTLKLDENEPTRSQLSVTIGTASLDTKMANRDKHLRAKDFFQVEDYPTMTFTGQRIETLDRATGHYRVTGVLNIRDVTRQISLDVQAASPRTDGDKKLIFNLSTVVDRRDFGLTWSNPIQKVSEEVKLDLTVQFVQI